MPYHEQQQGHTRKVTGEPWRVMCLCPTLCARCALFFYPSNRFRTCQLELTVNLRPDAPGGPDWGLRGAVTDGHGAGWQATALRPQEKRRTGIPVLGLS